MSDATTWRVVDPQQLRWRAWDEDDIVVYHPASGNTHLLNRLAAEALRALVEAPAGAAELARRLGARLEAELDDRLHAPIHALLQELEELGLIEPVPP